MEFCGAKAVGVWRVYDQTANGVEARATFRDVDAEVLHIVVFGCKVLVE